MSSTTNTPISYREDGANHTATTASPSDSTTAGSKEVASTFINLLVPPILITIGVTCNIMTVLTMRTKYFRKVSTSVYLKVGAFNDVLALLISLTAHWLYVNFPEVYIRTEYSNIMCCFFNFYGSGNNDFGILLTAIMTAERAFAIVSPFSAARFCSVKRAWKIVLCALVLVLLKEAHYLISSDIVPEERSDRLCDVFPERRSEAYQTYYYDYWPWINLAFVLLCGITILVSNSVIIHSVRNSAGEKIKGGQTWRHLVPMLIGESVMLIVLTFPFSLHLALLAVRVKYDSTIYTDPESAVRENLVFNATFYMLYSNKCANFFMYCITGSKFREGLSFALMSIFCNEKLKEKTRSTTSFMVRTISSHIPTRKDEDSNSGCSCSKSSCSKSTCSDDDSSDELDDVIECTEMTQKSYSVYM